MFDSILPKQINTKNEYDSLFTYFAYASEYSLSPFAASIGMSNSALNKLMKKIKRDLISEGKLMRHYFDFSDDGDSSMESFNLSAQSVTSYSKGFSPDNEVNSKYDVKEFTDYSFSVIHFISKYRQTLSLHGPVFIYPIKTGIDAILNMSACFCEVKLIWLYHPNDLITISYNNSFSTKRWLAIDLSVCGFEAWSDIFVGLSSPIAHLPITGSNLFLPFELVFFVGLSPDEAASQMNNTEICYSSQSNAKIRRYFDKIDDKNNKTDQFQYLSHNFPQQWFHAPHIKISRSLFNPTSEGFLKPYYKSFSDVTRKKLSDNLCAWLEVGIIRLSNKLLRMLSGESKETLSPMLLNERNIARILTALILLFGSQWNICKISIMHDTGLLYPSYHFLQRSVQFQPFRFSRRLWASAVYNSLMILGKLLMINVSQELIWETFELSQTFIMDIGTIAIESYFLPFESEKKDKFLVPEEKLKNPPDLVLTQEEPLPEVIWVKPDDCFPVSLNFDHSIYPYLLSACHIAGIPISFCSDNFKNQNYSIRYNTNVNSIYAATFEILKDISHCFIVSAENYQSIASSLRTCGAITANGTFYPDKNKLILLILKGQHFDPASKLTALSLFPERFIENDLYSEYELFSSHQETFFCPSIETPGDDQIRKRRYDRLTSLIGISVIFENTYSEHAIQIKMPTITTDYLEHIFRTEKKALGGEARGGVCSTILWASQQLNFSTFDIISLLPSSPSVADVVSLAAMFGLPKSSLEKAGFNENISQLSSSDRSNFIHKLISLSLFSPPIPSIYPFKPGLKVSEKDLNYRKILKEAPFPKPKVLSMDFPHSFQENMFAPYGTNEDHLLVYIGDDERFTDLLGIHRSTSQNFFIKNIAPSPTEMDPKEHTRTINGHGTKKPNPLSIEKEITHKVGHLRLNFTSAIALSLGINPNSLSVNRKSTFSYPSLKNSHISKVSMTPKVLLVVRQSTLQRSNEEANELRNAIKEFSLGSISNIMSEFTEFEIIRLFSERCKKHVEQIEFSNLMRVVWNNLTVLILVDTPGFVVPQRHLTLPHIPTLNNHLFVLQTGNGNAENKNILFNLSTCLLEAEQRIPEFSKLSEKQKLELTPFFKKIALEFNAIVEDVTNTYRPSFNSFVSVALNAYLRLTVFDNAWIETLTTLLSVFKRGESMLERITKEREIANKLRQGKLESQELIHEIELRKETAQDAKQKLAVTLAELEKATDSITIAKEAIEKKLSEVTPVIQKAIRDLKKLKIQDIAELKSMVKPPLSVVVVIEAVGVLLKRFEPRSLSFSTPEEKEEKLRKFWANARSLLSDKEILKSITITDGIMSQESIRAVIPYTKMPEMDPESLVHVSLAASSLGSWINASVDFYLAEKDAKPLREKLTHEEHKFKIVEDKASLASKNLADLEEEIAQLEQRREETEAHIKDLEEKFQEQKVISEHLKEVIELLFSEKVGWQENLEKHKWKVQKAETQALSITNAIFFKDFSKFKNKSYSDALFPISKYKEMIEYQNKEKGSKTGPGLMIKHTKYEGDPAIPTLLAFYEMAKSLGFVVFTVTPFQMRLDLPSIAAANLSQLKPSAFMNSSNGIQIQICEPLSDVEFMSLNMLISSIDPKFLDLSSIPVTATQGFTLPTSLRNYLISVNFTSENLLRDTFSRLSSTAKANVLKIFAPPILKRLPHLIAKRVDEPAATTSASFRSLVSRVDAGLHEIITEFAHNLTANLENVALIRDYLSKIREKEELLAGAQKKEQKARKALQQFVKVCDLCQMFMNVLDSFSERDGCAYLSVLASKEFLLNNFVRYNEVEKTNVEPFYEEIKATTQFRAARIFLNIYANELFTNLPFKQSLIVFLFLLSRFDEFFDLLDDPDEFVKALMSRAPFDFSRFFSDANGSTQEQLENFVGDLIDLSGGYTPFPPPEAAPIGYTSPLTPVLKAVQGPDPSKIKQLSAPFVWKGGPIRCLLALAVSKVEITDQELEIIPALLRQRTSGLPSPLNRCPLLTERDSSIQAAIKQARETQSKVLIVSHDKTYDPVPELFRLLRFAFKTSRAPAVVNGSDIDSVSLSSAQQPLIVTTDGVPEHRLALLAQELENLSTRIFCVLVFSKISKRFKKLRASSVSIFLGWPRLFTESVGLAVNSLFEHVSEVSADHLLVPGASRALLLSHALALSQRNPSPDVVASFELFYRVIAPPPAARSFNSLELQLKAKSLNTSTISSPAVSRRPTPGTAEKHRTGSSRSSVLIYDDDASASDGDEGSGAFKNELHPLLARVISNSVFVDFIEVFFGAENVCPLLSIMVKEKETTINPPPQLVEAMTMFIPFFATPHKLHEAVQNHFARIRLPDHPLLELQPFCFVPFITSSDVLERQVARLRGPAPSPNPGLNDLAKKKLSVCLANSVRLSRYHFTLSTSPSKFSLGSVTCRLHGAAIPDDDSTRLLDASNKNFFSAYVLLKPVPKEMPSSSLLESQLLPEEPEPVSIPVVGYPNIEFHAPAPTKRLARWFAIRNIFAEVL
eukprot:gnl/Chilomastix_cuspidata/5767.p1 GENE.gnl/Chilomastix_cuspidata/5767~~gnl/Chilomastix_cuspidata/5767.p1  ORF type:complete len:2856 (+),score=308.32 gnl/Chilomastix_cuspidata/5767:1037-8569(+)